MTREEIYNQLEASGLAQYWPTLQPHLRPAVKISTIPATEGLPIGISRFGGEPDLLPGTEWPYTKFGKPLRFLGQFNLAETAPLGTAGQLPEQGLLSFFHYDAFYFGNGTEEDEELDDRPGVVFYFPDVEGLQRASSPAPTFPEVALQLYATITVPNDRLNLSREIFGEDTDRYSHLHMNDFDWDYHQLMGYAPPLSDEDFVGADLQLQVNGISTLEKPMEVPLDEFCLQHGVHEGITDWQMLLRLDYDENLAWYWGKGGTLFFMIRKQDLAARDFSQVETYNQFV